MHELTQPNSPERGEGQMYEVVDEHKGDMVVSNPACMNGAGGGVPHEYELVNNRTGGMGVRNPGGEMPHEYEVVNRGGVAVSDATYTEVGAGGGNIQLKENEAYAVPI